MSVKTKTQRGLAVRVGYAAADDGRGIAYIRPGTAPSARVLRVPFRVSRQAGLGGREVGYGALAAVARVLRERHCPPAVIGLEDADLVEDLSRHRDVPLPLTLPYVRLRCALNQFAEVRIVHQAPSDLTARAQAEVALQQAA